MFTRWGKSQISNFIRKSLPTKLEICYLIAGECDIPEELINLFLAIITDNDPKRLRSENCMGKMRSISQDIIYQTFDGKIKTFKHITLGITYLIVNICNKLGHRCSYNTVGKLETEVTFFGDSKSTICRFNTVLNPRLCTSVAYDNYDRFVETCNGKDTLHDTVHILYQNIEDDDIVNS